MPLAVSGTVLALSLPLIAHSPASGTTVVADALQLVSTPDEPFVGGRVFDLSSPGASVVTDNEIIATFQRPDTDGVALGHDPNWVISIDPAQATQGDTLTLLRSSTALRLGVDQSSVVEWMGDSACPDLSGEVTFPEVTRDSEGTITSLSASFTLNCAAGDAVYGSYAYNASPPPMTTPAIEVALEDADFPNVRGGIPAWSVDPDDWDGLAVRVVGDDVLVRWDWRDGFRCAEVTTAPIGTLSETSEYIGLDDSKRLTSLDPTRSYQIHASFGAEPSFDGCQSVHGFTQSAVHALSVSVDPTPDVTYGDITRVGGVVQDTPEGPMGPRYDAENVRIHLWATTSAGRERVGTTTSGAAGRWSIDTVLSSRAELQVVVESGRGGWATDRWAHFGTQSETFVVRVAHRVTATVSDTTVQASSPVIISAQLRPSDETLPLYLERRTRQGAWMRMDTAVSEPHEATKLRLPSARRGWQTVRVVAPNDSWHSRGVSQRLRILGY